MEKLTISEVIERANLKHNFKYDYSESVYIKQKSKMEIICSKHGSFWQTPHNHIRNGVGCRECINDDILLEIINRSSIKHNFKYDYSKSVYVNSATKMEIVCPTHGSFWQLPNAHMGVGNGCRKCPNDDKALTLMEVIDRSNIKHNFKYDYSKVLYVNSRTPIEIICPNHGPFWQKPKNHLIGGCKKCSSEKQLLSYEELIMKFDKIHGNFYNYDKVIFIGVKRKVIITCPLHGDFEQTPDNHFKFGCASCAQNKPLSTEEIIIKFKEINGDRYNYSFVKYINMRTKVIIICPFHGKFKQTPMNHISNYQCKKCSPGNVSKIEHQWLDYIHLPNDANHRNVHLNINGKRFYVDGFIPGSNIIYEFLGDFWHGNPSIYDPKNINGMNYKTYGELFNKTVEKIRFFRQNGYKVISIWEKDFKKILQRESKKKKNERSKNIIDCRKSFKSKNDPKIFGR